MSDVSPKLPSSGSNAKAPGSEYVSPTSIVIGFDPSKVMLGGDPTTTVLVT